MFQPLRSFRGLICLAGLALPMWAGAQGLQVSAHTGLGLSDNVARVPGNEQQETIAEVGVDLSIQHKTRRLEVEALGDFAYQSYLKNTFDNDFVGSFAGNATLALIEDHLSWRVSDSFGQTRRDLAAGITPANRENVNYFDTGPSLEFSLPGDNKIEFSGSYNKIDYEKSPLDSERHSLEAAFTHYLTRGSSLGLHWRGGQTEYSELSSEADYDSQDAFLRYELNNSRSNLLIDAGANKVDGAGGEETGPLINVSYMRHITNRSTLWMEFSRELTDAGLTTASLSDLPTSDGSDLGLSQNSDPFTLDVYMIGWDIGGRRTDMQLAVTRFEENYGSLDGVSRVRDQFSGRVNRQLGSGWSAGLQAHYDRNTFDTDEADFNESSVWLSLAKQFSRQLFFDAAFEHFQRDSDAVQSDYQENRIWLRVRYGGLIRTPFGPNRRLPTPETETK